MIDFKKVNENFEITIATNGFMVDFCGRDADDNWVRSKLICKDTDELMDTIGTIIGMEVER